MAALDDRRLVRLHPGDVAFGSQGDRLETLLGSCVSIILTDPRRTVAAMCHVVHSGQHAPRRAASASAAYGDGALRLMCDGLRARGINPSLCDAYVYGGGNMFPQFRPSLDVGQGNADWALRSLQGLGAQVRHVDLGGTVYRRLSWQVGAHEPEVTAVDMSA